MKQLQPFISSLPLVAGLMLSACSGPDKTVGLEREEADILAGFARARTAASAAAAIPRSDEDKSGTIPKAEDFPLTYGDPAAGAGGSDALKGLLREASGQGMEEEQRLAGKASNTPFSSIPKGPRIN